MMSARRLSPGAGGRRECPRAAPRRARVPPRHALLPRLAVRVGARGDRGRVRGRADQPRPRLVSRTRSGCRHGVPVCSRSSSRCRRRARRHPAGILRGARPAAGTRPKSVRFFRTSLSGAWPVARGSGPFRCPRRGGASSMVRGGAVSVAAQRLGARYEPLGSWLCVEPVIAGVGAVAQAVAGVGAVGAAVARRSRGEGSVGRSLVRRGRWGRSLVRRRSAVTAVTC